MLREATTPLLEGITPLPEEITTMPEVIMPPLEAITRPEEARLQQAVMPILGVEMRQQVSFKRAYQPSPLRSERRLILRMSPTSQRSSSLHSFSLLQMHQVHIADLFIKALLLQLPQRPLPQRLLLTKVAGKAVKGQSHLLPQHLPRPPLKQQQGQQPELAKTSEERPQQSRTLVTSHALSQ